MVWGGEREPFLLMRYCAAGWEANVVRKLPSLRILPRLGRDTSQEISSYFAAPTFHQDRETYLLWITAYGK